MKEKELWNLFQSMTLAEKLGQMTQTTGEYFVGKEFAEELVVTGPAMEEMGFDSENIQRVGSVLGVSSSQAINAVQRAYLEKSRLGIPLMFMHDAIHGYRTIFPIPLALASTFNTKLIEKVGHLTGQELVATGIKVNFSPMVDLVRDARWGRVMESFGEDSILSGRLGRAMIEGYQGSADGTIGKQNVIACLKHFVAYGAPDGGRDYASVDMSKKELFGFYAKSFEIALMAFPRMVMASFNSFNGEPVTASSYLLEEVLRQKFTFTDLLISDWGAVSELKNHGIAANDKEAGYLALNAGIEIEMVSNTFLKYGEEYLSRKPSLIEKINQAVWDFLNLKNEFGLFEHPYVDENEEQKVIRSKKIVNAACEISEASCVLLKNENDLLPLKKEDTLLIIGPFAKTQDLLGNWNCKGKAAETISVEQGFKNLASNVHAYKYLDEVPEELLEKSDNVLVTIGERWDKSGEGHSSVDLEIDTAQQSLIYDLKAMGKKVIGLGFSGRPMALGAVIDDLDALLWTWYLGNEAGNAIANLILGIKSPTGRLAMSFPRVSAQVPLRYNELGSGRPANDSTYSSRYQDLPIGPLFPFGYGLRYGRVKIAKVELSSSVISDDNPLNISLELTNNSEYDTSESIILFMEDSISKIVRPVRELIDFQCIALKKGENRKVEFVVQTSDLAYINNEEKKVFENGTINFYINDLNKKVANVEVQNRREGIYK